MADFLRRVAALPTLGLGVSTEYGARTADTLDPLALRAHNAHWGGFLEVGLELAKGLDADALAWIDAGHPTTYHFLDVNLDDPADLDPVWLAGVQAAVARMRPAWICGDAGLWHFGARDRGHMLLLPPVLLPEAIGPMAEGIAAIRAATGCEVLPENPPGAAFVGEMHLLDFFGELAHRADTGLLLDCAHLAMYQRALGHGPLDGLDGAPLDRVVELHIAGGSVRDHEGLAWVEDDHGDEILADTWAIVEHVLERAPNLKAVVVECERNPLPVVLPLYAQVAARTDRVFRPGATP